MWIGVKAEARRKGVSCDLPLTWFEEKLKAGHCEMSGLAFDFETIVKGSPGPNTPSVDRIVAGGNYTASNCRLILFCINRALSNFGEDYILKVFSQVLARRKNR